MEFAPIGALTIFKTRKQIQILRLIYLILNKGEKHTLSSLNRRVRKETKISEPTIRRVLIKLREKGFIVAGFKGNEGIEVSINRGYGRKVMHSAPDREKGVRLPLTPFNLNEKRVR